MNSRYWLTYLILLIAQIILGDMLNLSQYITLFFLPVMILSLPVSIGSTKAMAIAFATGFAVDFFTHGVLGLTISALVPVALSRLLVLKLVFGNELLARKEDLSVHKQGMLKVAVATLMSTALFLAIYVPVDCAGARPFSFIAARILLSLLVSVPVSLYAANLLSVKEADRWN